jgi:CHAT domain-containing protein
MASLSYPQPLDLAATRRALPPSTLLLSYAVGEQATLLFAVGPGERFAVHRLPAGREEMAAEVDRLRRLLMRPSGELRASGRLAAQRLGELLLAPVADQLAAAERLLVVPDGALHGLPFAALAWPGDARRYLVEGLALAFAPSATTLAGSLATPLAATPRRRLVAFADPRHPVLTDPAAPAALRGLARLGEGTLPELPGARREAERIAGGWPGGSTVWVGEQATEDRAKRLDAAGIVHFACHALVDAEHPLESGLVLAPSADRADNGLLQAWEIYESASFDADLVTLSACDTGLGESLAGEGVLGLTRAFHYAGADSVLATLWPVTDHHTAMLMEELYRQLAAGAGRAEALRRAQLELLRSGAHPYHWAGYQLSGDWR